LKKILITALALLLAIGVLIPQTALAITTYSVRVTLTGPDQYGVMQTVSASSSKYNTRSSKVGPEVVLAMGPESYRHELETKFDNSGMRSVFDDGAAALASGRDEWLAYLDKYPFVYSNETMTRDYNATIGDLIDAGGTEWVSMEKNGKTYVVTVIVEEHYSGVYIPPTTDPDGPVYVNEEHYTGDEMPVDGGTTTVGTPNPKPGDPVTVLVTPDPGKRIKKIKVFDTDRNPIKVTYEGDGEYTFDAPEGEVYIEVEFRVDPAKPEETGIAGVLQTDDHFPFMIGDTEGNFRPYDNITRAEVSMIFYRLLLNKDVERTIHFDDTAASAWYTEAIETLAALNIVNGVNGSRFAPDKPCTRAQFAAICSRFANSTAEKRSFFDTTSHWANSEISTAAAYGWITGYDDGTFAPDAYISREEAAAIVNRLLYRFGDLVEIDSGAGRRFPDTNDAMWSWYDIVEATSNHDFENAVDFAYEEWTAY